MSVLIKITKVYKVDIFENGERINTKSEYALTKERAKQKGIEMLQFHKWLDEITKDLLEKR